MVRDMGVVLGSGKGLRATHTAFVGGLSPWTRHCGRKLNWGAGGVFERAFVDVARYMWRKERRGHGLAISRAKPEGSRAPRPQHKRAWRSSQDCKRWNCESDSLLLV
jgi:hypothetical protein